MANLTDAENNFSLADLSFTYTGSNFACTVPDSASRVTKICVIGRNFTDTASNITCRADCSMCCGRNFADTVHNSARRAGNSACLVANSSVRACSHACRAAFYVCVDHVHGHTVLAHTLVIHKTALCLGVHALGEDTPTSGLSTPASSIRTRAFRDSAPVSRGATPSPRDHAPRSRDPTPTFCDRAPTLRDRIPRPRDHIRRLHASVLAFSNSPLAPHHLRGILKTHMGRVSFLSVGFVLVNLLTDLAYAKANKRVALG